MNDQTIQAYIFKFNETLQQMKNHYLQYINDCKEDIQRTSDLLQETQMQTDTSENSAYSEAVNSRITAMMDLNLYKSKLAELESFSIVQNKQPTINIGGVVKLTLQNEIPNISFTEGIFLIVPRGMGNAGIGYLDVNSVVGRFILNRSGNFNINVSTPIGTLSYGVEQIL